MRPTPRQHEQTPKKPTPIINAEPFAAPKLVSLDTIRFNESLFDPKTQGLDPVQQVLENVRTENNTELSEFWDTSNDMFEKFILQPYHLETKGRK